MGPSISFTVCTLCAFLGMRVFLLFVCVPLCFVHSSEDRKEGVHHLLNEVLRLSCFNAMLNGFGIPFSCHRRTGTGYALLSVRSHVACVKKTCALTARGPISKAMKKSWVEQQWAQRNAESNGPQPRFHGALAKVHIPLARRALKWHGQLGVEAGTRQLVVLRGNKDAAEQV